MRKLVTIEVDTDTLDEVVVDSLRDAAELIKKNMVESAANFDLEYHRQNMRDYYRDLEAIERVIFYYTGAE